MVAYRPLWRGLTVAAALAAAACGESSAPQQPQLQNPQQLSSDMQTVSAVFATPVFKSFGVIGTAVGSPVASTAPAGALLSAARVPAPPGPRPPYVDAAARVRALQVAATALTSSVSASVIPDTDLAKTFEWDVSTHQYVVGSDPGPSTGVRIILYAVDPITEQIVESSLTPVGFVDLLDESSGNTNQLHVIVQSGTPASPGATYVDYSIGATVTPNDTGQASAFQATVPGYLSDGTRTLDFDASFSATNLDTDNPDAQIDVTWDLDAPVVGVALHETFATANADQVTVTVDFSVARGGETVRLAGTVAADLALDTQTADLTVYVNGQAFARITGSATATTNDVRIVHADGTALSLDERLAVAGLFLLPDDIFDALDRLISPAENLMGA